MNNDPEHEVTGRQLVYYAAERTLMAWIRTALSLMALGFVIDRFGLVLRQMLPATGPELHSRAFSFLAGTVLVLLGSAMACVAVVRYLRFALDYRQEQSLKAGNGILLGVLFTAIVAILGLVIAGFLISAMA